MLEITSKIYKSIESEPQRSAWDKGVSVYALELVQSIDEAITGGYFCTDDIAAPAMLRKAMLNGASDWHMYSWGGCALVYDSDIAERLCTPSAYRRCRGGERRPNGREEWLDVQARALYQACNRVIRHARRIAERGGEV